MVPPVTDKMLSLDEIDRWCRTSPNCEVMDDEPPVTDAYKSVRNLAGATANAIAFILKLPGDYRGDLASFDRGDSAYNTRTAQIIYSPESRIGRTLRRIFTLGQATERRLTPLEQENYARRSSGFFIASFSVFLGEDIVRGGFNIYELAAHGDKYRDVEKAIIVADTAGRAVDGFGVVRYLQGQWDFRRGFDAISVERFGQWARTMQIAGPIEFAVGVSRLSLELYDHSHNNKELSNATLLSSGREIGNGIFFFARSVIFSAAANARATASEVARAYATLNFDVARSARWMLRSPRYIHPTINAAICGFEAYDTAKDPRLSEQQKNKRYRSLALMVGATVLSVAAATVATPLIAATATTIAIFHFLMIIIIGLHELFG